MAKHALTLSALVTLIALATFDPHVAAAGSKQTSGGTGWSGASAISPLCQPDPTRGSQLNDVAVNANGLTVAAWDQYTCTTGGPYTVGWNAIVTAAFGSFGRPASFSDPYRPSAD